MKRSPSTMGVTAWWELLGRSQTRRAAVVERTEGLVDFLRVVRPEEKQEFRPGSPSSRGLAARGHDATPPGMKPLWIRMRWPGTSLCTVTSC